MTVLLALSYSGRDDIARMVQDIARKVRDGVCAIEDIDEEMIAAHMDTSSIPDPDLLIRTSGEMRLSNFSLATCLHGTLRHAYALARFS